MSHIGDSFFNTAVFLTIVSLAFWKLPRRIAVSLALIVVAYVSNEAINSPGAVDSFEPTLNTLFQDVAVALVLTSFTLLFTPSFLPGIYAGAVVVAASGMGNLPKVLLWRLFPAVAVASLAASRGSSASPVDPRIKAVRRLLASNVALLAAMKGERSAVVIDDADEEEGQTWSLIELLPLGFLALNLVR